MLMTRTMKKQLEELEKTLAARFQEIKDKELEDFNRIVADFKKDLDRVVKAEVKEQIDKCLGDD